MREKDGTRTQIITPTFPRIGSATLPQDPQVTVGDWPHSAYLHIPFCRTRCRYCDFAIAVGTAELVEKYVTYLLREIGFTPTVRQSLATVYFGGGTPSLLSANQVGRILAALDARFGIAPGAEISLEANPGTFDLDQIRGYQDSGINRISLGVQSFQDHLLTLCGRAHDLKAVYESVDLLEQAGFENFNLDLIFGLPEQTLADWEHSLQEVVRLAPAHVSLYDLILEEETPFGRRYRAGAAPLPTDEETVEMYLQTLAVLAAAGFDHYEIANFARPGRQCAHNRVYWKNRPYYGIGTGATGYVHNQRIDRPRRLYDYFQLVDSGIFPQQEPVSEEEQLADTLMLGLRLLEGVALDALIDRFGTVAVANVLEVLKSQGKGYVLIEPHRLMLTIPEGILFSNEVFGLLI